MLVTHRVRGLASCDVSEHGRVVMLDQVLADRIDRAGLFNVADHAGVQRLWTGFRSVFVRIIFAVQLIDLIEIFLFANHLLPLLVRTLCAPLCGWFETRRFSLVRKAARFEAL